MDVLVLKTIPRLLIQELATLVLRVGRLSV